MSTARAPEGYAVRIVEAEYKSVVAATQVNRIRRLFIDLETRSKLILQKVGVDVYSTDCQILIIAWAYDNNPVQVATCDQGIPAHVLADLTNADVLKLAWNAQFERAVLREQLGISSPIEQWFDPAVLARRAGLSGTLKLTSGFLNPKTQAKNEEGSQLIKLFSKSKETAKRGVYFEDWNEPKHAEAWKRFQDYCKQDVVAERAVHNRLEAGFTPSAFERKLWELDQRINERGMPISVEYVRNARVIVDRERKRLADDLTTLTGLENINSVKQLLEWLSGRGYPYSSLGKGYVAKALQGPYMAGVSEALKLRQALAKTSVSKLKSIENRSRDARVRYSYRFQGSHTGRWSGEGVQLQNLARTPSKWGEDEVNVRACFQAPEGSTFVVADLSSIETLVLAWLTRCNPLLLVFDRGEDPYVDFASSWFGTLYADVTKEQRQLAKPAVLGCGYGLGGGELIASCCRKPVCNCGKNKEVVKGGLWGYGESADMTREQAHDAVRAYRAKYWQVTDFWSRVEAAAIEAAVTGAARKHFVVVFGAIPQKLLWVELPSGRRLHYPNPQVSANGHGTELSYARKGLYRRKLYGAKLTENLVQAISRDVLAEGMIRADAAGLTITGHTHDELICLEPADSSDALDRLIAAMTAPVSWAPDLKLKAEGYEGRVYKK
jgi:DNA polymerase